MQLEKHFGKHTNSIDEGIELYEVIKKVSYNMLDAGLNGETFSQFADLRFNSLTLAANAGRVYLEEYLEGMFDRFALNTKAISDADVTHYAISYGALEQLRAGLGFYRAFPADEKFNAAQRSRLDVPIILAGGDHSVAPNLPRIAESLRKNGCANVTVEVIAGSGHYVVDEQPEIVAELIERYASL